MKSKYLPRRPGNDLMHTTEMCETSNSSSSPSGTITGTYGRSGAVEHGRKLFTCCALRRRRGGGPGEGCARRPVGTYLYLHAVGVGNHVAVLGLAR
jgi:hypothetical protein